MTVSKNYSVYFVFWPAKMLAGIWFVIAFFILATLPFMPRIHAQEQAVQRGEAFVTRFSGAVTQGGQTVIDTAGAVGSLVDIRRPGAPAQGQHWTNEPQRLSVTAGDVGQVFGIAFDDATPANIYLTATSAFGLHRTSDNTDWMDGMWGAKGGPGTVWKLNASNNYKPEVFAIITLRGRANTGAALGNIAYDRWSKQLYVSDLETGMIHRLAISDGSDDGQYDHGTQGRASFIDAATGASQSLSTVAFDAKTRTRIKDCPDGTFANSLTCWNVADFRRRVWGLGVHRDTASGEIRLYYAVWSSQGLGNKAFAGAADQEKRNSVWSVAIATDGSFDSTSVRREFFLPNFFTDAADIARARKSHPVSDIAFSATGVQTVMLVAERGGLRNLGLDARAPFARPHEARVLRYALDANGVWQSAGRYEVGFYDRKKHGAPHLRANAAGGVAFGFGYDPSGATDTTETDKVVWATGDALCDPDGPCTDPATGKQNDISEVHGLQGIPEDTYDKVVPVAALKPYPATGVPYSAKGPNKAYMIDIGINVDASGTTIATELARDDATKVGDVEVYAPVAPPAVAAPPAVTPGVPAYPPGVTPPGVLPPPGPPPLPAGPDLGIAKVHTGAPCAAGASCSFIVAVTNNGSVPFSGPLYIRDALPKGAKFVSNSPGWNCAPSGANVACYHPPLTLAPGAMIDVGLTLSLPAGLKGGTQVTNCASISWMMKGPPNKIVFERALKLAGYNPGPVDGVIDAQAKAAILNYQVDHGLLPPTGKLDPSLRKSLFGGGAGMGDANPGNDGPACATVNVTAGKPKPKYKFDLIIKKKPVGGPCLPGGKCKFEITVKNVGTKDYKGEIKIFDIMPAGWTLDSHHGGLLVWICGPKGSNKFTCKHHPSVPVGAGNWFGPGDSATVTITANVPANAKGPTVENCASIIDNPKVPQDKVAKANDRDCVKIALPGPQKTGSDLEMKKDIAGMLMYCQPNSICKFEIAITNNGPDPYTQAVVFEDAMPVGWQFSKQTGAGWQTCSVNGPTIRCETIPTLLTTPPIVTLKVNETIKLGLELKTPPAIANSKKVENCAKVFPHAKASDKTPSNNKSCILLDVPGDPSLKLADLRVFKTGPAKCWENYNCIYKIAVVNYRKVPYEGPIRIIESSLPGIKYVKESNGWSCKDIASGKIQCDHKKIRLGHLQFPRPLGLMVAWPWLPPPAKEVENCAEIAWPAGKGDFKASNDKDCAVTAIARGGTVTGTTSWGWYEWYQLFAPWQIAVEGTKDCIYGNCSFYQFTARLQKTPQAQRYSGPLRMSISVPPRSDFPSAEISGGGDSCGADGWSCTKTSQGFDCTNLTCTMQPGGEVRVRMDGKLVPHMKVPPRVEQERTACGVLKWRVPKSKGIDIEQLGDKRTTRACHTTRILPVKEPEPEAVKPEPPEPKKQMADLALAKSGPAECMAGGVCLYKLTVTNRGPGIYEAPLTIVDERPQGWKLLGGYHSPPWKCTKSGATIKCLGNVTLAPGDSVPLLLELRVPARSNRMPRKMVNCAQIEWPGVAAQRQRGSVTQVQRALNQLGYELGRADGKLGRRTRAAIRRYQKDRGLPQTGAIDDRLVQSLIPAAAAVSGDPNSQIDRACVTTTIAGPPEEGPPEPRPVPSEPKKAEPITCPPGQGLVAEGQCCRPSEIWDGKRCTCPRGEIWTGKFCAPPEAKPRPRCTAGQRWDAIEGMCVSTRKPKKTEPATCPRSQHWDRALRRCVCPKGQRWDTGRRHCVPREVKCPPGQSRNRAGQCVCPQGQRWDTGQRRCVPREVRCPPGQSRRGGRCVCAEGYRWHQGRCVEREE